MSPGPTSDSYKGSTSAAWEEARRLLRRMDECPTCGGIGTVSDESTRVPAQPVYQAEQVTCPRCQGTGKWESPS